MRWIWLTLGVVLSVACGEFERDGCVDDDGCKLGRLCQAGLCVDPAPIENAMAPTAGSTAPMVVEAEATQPSPDTAGQAEEPAVVAATEPPLPAVEPATNTSAEFLCEPSEDPAAGACQNADDCELVQDGSARSVAQDCGIGCVTSLNLDCAADCIQAEVALSDPCTACLEGFFDCILAQCLGPCASGTADECTECSRTRPAGNSCSDQFYACSGTELNPDYEAP